MRNNGQLPNMRNLGVNLRLLVMVNVMLVLAAMVLSSNSTEFFTQIAAISVFAQPIVLISILLLYAGNPVLKKLNYWQGIAAMMGVVLATCVAVHGLLTQSLLFNELPSLPRTLLFAGVISGISLYYFYLHYRAHSPALVEARLQALQARIRPHFLFNSINAVLSLIRSQPKQAETALEDMADLFRVLMADNRDLVPLAQEIALCRQYLSLEKLRLDERLTVQWQIDDMPPDALIPPLILQPLIENAVYHGIEPLAGNGTISIRIYTKSREVHIILSNPYNVKNSLHSGNKMALKNIKERLTLHFDLEATLNTSQNNGEYQVHITLPHTKT